MATPFPSKYESPFCSPNLCPWISEYSFEPHPTKLPLSPGRIWELVFPGSSCPFDPSSFGLDVQECWVEPVARDWGEAALLSLIAFLQRQNGPGQRVIREVNTTTRACALWGLAEDSDYTVQVRSIGLRGESPPGPRVHFRTLKGSDRLPSNSSSPGECLSYFPLPNALHSLAFNLDFSLLFTSPKQATV